jgi:hypothetical protein
MGVGPLCPSPVAAQSEPAVLDLRSYISSISFRAIEPQYPLGPDRRLKIPRLERPDAKVLELPGAPLDVFNTALPEGEAETRQALGPICEMPRMSTFAFGAVLNHAVAAMPADQVYVNVGVWQGFMYFAGALGNPGKRCIGVDNFSQWSKEDVRLALEDRLARIGTPSQTMHTMDYREYFANVHRDPIGVYVYDGDHAYEHQLNGLRIAEPYLADGCVVIVEDTNSHDPYEATLDFIAQSDRRWDMLLDCDTSVAGHPTWWNGLIVIQDGGRRDPAISPVPERGGLHGKLSLPGPPAFVSEPLASNAALITLIVGNHGNDPEGLGRAVEQALDQSWPQLEVIVADQHPGEACRDVLASFGDRIRTVKPDRSGAVRAAIAESYGEFVGFLDCDATIRPSAIEMGLAFPRASRFNTELTAERLVSIEQALAASAVISRSIPAGRRFSVATTEQFPRLEGLEAGIFMGENARSTTPNNATELIEALRQVRRSGAEYIAFTRSCVGWLDAFPRFREHLEAGARRLVDDEHVLVYELLEEPVSSSPSL